MVKSEVLNRELESENRQFFICIIYKFAKLAYISKVILFISHTEYERKAD